MHGTSLIYQVQCLVCLSVLVTFSKYEVQLYYIHQGHDSVFLKVVEN